MRRAPAETSASGRGVVARRHTCWDAREKVTRCWAMARRIRVRHERGSTTTWRPTDSGSRNRTVRPVGGERAAGPPETLSSVTWRTAEKLSSIRDEFAMDSKAPLGRPVVPDVYRHTATSSACPSRSETRGAERLDASPRNRSAPNPQAGPPRARMGHGRPSPSRPARRTAGSSRRRPWPRPRNPPARSAPRRFEERVHGPQCRRHEDAEVPNPELRQLGDIKTTRSPGRIPLRSATAAAPPASPSKAS